MATTELTPSPQQQPTSLFLTILHWLFFGVVMTLAPFLVVLIDDIDRNITPNIEALFGRGELLIVAAIIAAGGIGQLFGTDVPSKHKASKLIVVALCIVTVFATCFWFGDVSSLVISKHPPNPHTIAWGSVIIFVSTVIAGVSALALSEI